MNPANVCTSGDPVKASSRNGFTLSTAADLAPGHGERAEVTIVNLGALPAALRLLETSASNEHPAGSLALEIRTIREGASERIFLGEVGGVPESGIDLGPFGPGESRTYRFTLFLRNGAQRNGRVRRAEATYAWTAAPLGAIRD